MTSAPPNRDPIEAILKRVRIYGTNLFRPRLVDFWRASASIGSDATQILTALAPTRVSMLDRVAEEFRQHMATLRDRVGPSRSVSSVPKALTATEAQFRYAQVRLRPPRHVVETGVALGVSTFFLLRALRENHAGKLTSFDVNASAGSLLREEDTDGWQFVVLNPRRARREFVEHLDQGGPLDLFVHDSDHSYGHQRFEYSSVFPWMSQGSLLASDDVDGSFAYLDFCREHDLRAHYLVSPTKLFGIAEVSQPR